MTCSPGAFFWQYSRFLYHYKSVNTKGIDELTIAASRAQLDSLIKRLPMGLETLVGERG